MLIRIDDIRLNGDMNMIVGTDMKTETGCVCLEIVRSLFTVQLESCPVARTSTVSRTSNVS
jgi:hypothetical protein